MQAGPARLIDETHDHGQTGELGVVVGRSADQAFRHRLVEPVGVLQGETDLGCVVGLQEGVRTVLEACAPSIRTADEGRNWHDYAQRTARYAFGPDGSRMLAKIERYREDFLRLEGRDPALEGPRMGS